MPNWVAIGLIIVCIMLVGFIEVACASEGLMKGCMD